MQVPESMRMVCIAVFVCPTVRWRCMCTRHALCDAIVTKSNRYVNEHLQCFKNVYELPRISSLSCALHFHKRSPPGVPPNRFPLGLCVKRTRTKMVIFVLLAMALACHVSPSDNPSWICPGQPVPPFGSGLFILAPGVGSVSLNTERRATYFVRNGASIGSSSSSVLRELG
jgi:hypothetical protein